MKRFKFAVLLLALSFSGTTFCQSPYALNWKKEGIFTTVGIGSWAGSYMLSSNLNSLTPGQLSSLHSENLLAVDRPAIGYGSLSAHKASNYLLYGAHLLPFALMADSRTRNDYSTIAALYGETFIITGGLTMLTKNLVRRPRPYVFSENVDISYKETKNARNSFFSGHTSMTAAMTFFTAKVYADYHPGSKWKPVVWGLATTVPAVTGYLRVRGGKHFPTDVATGYAVGAAIGYLVPHLHKNKSLDEKGLSFYGGPGNVLMRWQF